jgi:protein TonB
MKTYHWILSLAAAFVLHVVVIKVALAYSDTNTNHFAAAVDEGEGGIEIGLGMMGSYVDQAETQNDTIKTEVENKATEQPVEEDSTTPTPEPIVTPPIPTKIVTAKKSTLTPIAVAEKPPKQDPKSENNQQAKPVAEIKPVIANKQRLQNK